MSAIRAPSKYENVATVHVVHCGPWGCIRQPEDSFVSEYETGAIRREPGEPAHAAIVERFGPEILGPDGAIDRPALAAIVFGDPAAL